MRVAAFGADPAGGAAPRAPRCVAGTSKARAT